MYITHHCINKAFFAFDGLPLFLFVPIFTFFASGGGLQYFNLIDIPIVCLQTKFFINDGQVHVASFHFSGLLDKHTHHICK